MLEYPTVFPVHPRNRAKIIEIYEKNKGFSKVIPVEPVGYFTSIHCIKEAITVVTDSGGVLQEANFIQTPYVFIFDMKNVPAGTEYDVSRLAKPYCDDIRKAVLTEQSFMIKMSPDFSVRDKIVKYISKLL